MIFSYNDCNIFGVARIGVTKNILSLSGQSEYNFRDILSSNW